MLNSKTIPKNQHTPIESSSNNRFNQAQRIEASLLGYQEYDTSFTGNTNTELL